MRRELPKNSHWLRIRVSPAVTEQELVELFAANGLKIPAENISRYEHTVDKHPMCTIGIPPNVICELVAARLNGATLHGHSILPHVLRSKRRSTPDERT